MNKNKLLLLASTILTISLLFGTSNQAQADSKYNGLILKGDIGSEIYYVATDGKKYVFPNEQVYFSWFHSFSVVKTVPQIVVAEMLNGATQVTLFPGNQLVQFGNNPEVYMVRRKATLRWIPDEKTAEKLSGKNWTKHIIRLPENNLKSYNIGEVITDPAEIVGPYVLRRAQSINDELSSMGFIKKTKKTGASKLIFTDKPTLESISENLSANLNPSFSKGITSYTLTAKNTEESIELLSKATNENATIKVNGIKVPNVAIKYKLNEGSNKFTINVTLDNGESLNYIINVTRLKVGAIDKSTPSLSSLKENLKGNFSPGFASNKYEYSLQAAYNESIVEITPETEDDAVITIGSYQNQARSIYTSQKVVSGKSLPVVIYQGENKIRVDVKKANGRSRNYVINVNKVEYATAEYSQLNSITITNIKSMIPSFDRVLTDYEVIAQGSATSVTIKAVPRDGQSKVTINGSLGQEKTINIKDAALVTIEVESVDGLKKIYYLNISK